MEQAIAIGENLFIRPDSYLGGRQDLRLTRRGDPNYIVVHLGAMIEEGVIPVTFGCRGYPLSLRVGKGPAWLFFKNLREEGLLPLAWSNWQEPLRRAIEEASGGGDQIALEKELAGLFRSCKYKVLWGGVTEITRKMLNLVCRRRFP